MARCYHCKIELEKGEKELCILCREMPRCSGCEIIGTHICHTCENWLELMKTTCFLCGARINQTPNKFKIHGNLCKYCDFEIDEKLSTPPKQKKE